MPSDVHSACKRLAVFFVVPLLTFALLHTGAAQAAPAQLTVGVFHQQGPYSHFDSAGRAHGLAVETLASLQDDDQHFQYRHIPHGRIVYALSQGSVDFALLLLMRDDMVQPEIESVVITRQALFSVPLYLYVDRARADSLSLPETFSVIRDLVGLKVGLYRANASNNYISLKNSPNVVFFNRYESAIKSLMSQRVDALGIDPLSASYWEERFNMQLEQKHYLGQADVHLAFSGTALGAQALALCESYWGSLKSQSETGVYNRLSERQYGAEFLALLSVFEQQDSGNCHSL